MDKQLLWQHGEQYVGATLDPNNAASDPFVQFRAWFAAAEVANVATVNAMTLATVDRDGWPQARIVLLKEIDARGLVFYTNYESAKGRELAAHPRASVLFFWEPLHRQIRVVGDIERVSAAESDAYFAVRPRGSQLAAIASPQSATLASRDELAARVTALDTQYADSTPPRPAHWGGYRLVPQAFEFWQGQPSRMHDRVQYTQRDGGWQRVRLAP